MNVSECMTRDVKMGRPDDSLQSIARLMAAHDTGVIPIGENDRVVGMITDRDLAVRAMAEALGADTKAREIMSKDIRYCYEDESVGEALKSMGAQQIRRLPVLSRDERLVGIVSLGDMAIEAQPTPTGEALGEISKPGGSHSQ